MLQRMIAHGATIFLTSHVLEIVERLCTHVGIINSGRLVAQGSLDELRSGVVAGTALQAGEKMTLEEFFLHTVGGTRSATQELSWLG
jgi:ABC-2 type transport system ATP-binding protein